MVELVHFPHSV